MPPMALTGVVTKVGYMQKTATVTVSRWMVHRKTHKVSSCCDETPFTDPTIICNLHQRIERSKKYLVHDAEDGATLTLPYCATAQKNSFIALKMGDTVLIRNCPPVSARKRFKLETIIKSPETEWEQAHACTNAGSIGDGGEAQDQGTILQELQRVRKASPSKVAQGSMMADVLGSGSASYC